MQSLWDRIAAAPETIPVPDWHREILEERLKDLDANPDAGDTWEVVQERLRKKFDSPHFLVRVNQSRRVDQVRRA